jgi:hypothetical protein
MIESIIEKLKLLKLKTCADNIIPVIEGAKEKNWSALQIIEHLLDLELEIREKNRIALRFKQSRLLEKPTIDQFDFDFHISRKKQKNRILNLMDLERNTIQCESPLYHRYGYDQSSDRCRSRPFSVEKTPLLSISGSPCH